MSANLKNFFWLVFLASLWGPSFLFIKIAIEFIQPITLTAFRLGLGSLVLFTILKFQKVKLPNLKGRLKHVLAAGLIQSAIPFTLFAIGEKSIESSLAAIICGSAPLFTMVLAHFFNQNDQLTKLKVSGATIGFFGLLILISPALSGANSTAFGILTVLVGAICYAIAFVYVKKFINLNDFEPLTLPTIQLFFSFLFLLPLALIFENPAKILLASKPAIFSAFGLAFFGSALAFVIYYKLLKSTSASFTAMVNYIVPVFGIILGSFVLDEKLSWNVYFGGALILFGVMTANGVFKNFLSSRSTPNAP